MILMLGMPYFRYFNQVHGNGNVSYQPGEKIAIKLNFNNALGGIGDPYVKEDNDRDASPYVVKALLRQLVNVVGVAQEDITLFDASRPIPNWFYNRVYYETYPADPLVEEFSHIHYVDSTGGATGREQVIPSSTKMYFSDGVRSNASNLCCRGKIYHQHAVAEKTSDSTWV